MLFFLVAKFFVLFLLFTFLFLWFYCPIFGWDTLDSADVCLSLLVLSGRI